MCGINGFNFSNEELIRKMNAKVKHRGPDGDGVFVCGDASLGHTRLSIIDLSEKASQPMFSRDESLVLVFNGEIYNFQEIRDELRKKGHQFRSNSDSEVILNSYIEYGVDCLQKFNGIFAFAIFDKKDNGAMVLLLEGDLGSGKTTFVQFYFLATSKPIPDTFAQDYRHLLRILILEMFFLHTLQLVSLNPFQI